MNRVIEEKNRNKRKKERYVKAVAYCSKRKLKTNHLLLQSDEYIYMCNSSTNFPRFPVASNNLSPSF